MIDTFDALATFDENGERENAENMNSTAAVDMSAIINRLNDLETKINAVLAQNAQTEPNNSEQGNSNSEQNTAPTTGAESEGEKSEG